MIYLHKLYDNILLCHTHMASVHTLHGNLFEVLKIAKNGIFCYNNIIFCIFF